MYKQIEHVFALQKLPEMQASSHQTQVLLAPFSSSPSSSFSSFSTRRQIQGQSSQSKWPQQQQEVHFHPADFCWQKLQGEKVEKKMAANNKGWEPVSNVMVAPLVWTQHNMKKTFFWHMLFPRRLFKTTNWTNWPKLPNPYSLVRIWRLILPEEALVPHEAAFSHTCNTSCTNAQ